EGKECGTSKRRPRRAPRARLPGARPRPARSRGHAAFLMRAAPLLFAALVLVSAGCSNRDRNNPFDPGNPDTGGMPPDFRAIADDRKNTLTWGTVVSPSLAGF